MDSSIIGIVLFSSFLIPALIFSLIATYGMESTNRKFNYDDFLYTRGDAKPSDFNNSSIAYMLQIYVTFYFIFWGYNYGFSNIFYLLSWAIGIWLFIRFAPQIIVELSKSETFPNLISNDSKLLRIVFGCITSFFFAGMLFLETYFATDFINIVGTNIGNPIKGSWWLIFTTLLFLVVCYSSWGGQKKVYLTDKYQLASAYLGFAVVISYLVTIGFKENPGSMLVIWILALILFGFLIYATSGTTSSKPIQISLYFSFLILLFIGLYSFNIPENFSYNIPGFFTQIKEPGGLIALFGFMLLNIIWQFCDSSNYQRLYSIRNAHNDDFEKIKNVVKKEFRPIIFISPITWGLGILLGMSIQASGIESASLGEEYSSLIVFLTESILNLTNHPYFALFAIFSLGVAVTSITLSTSDSSAIAFHQSFFRDVLNLNIKSFLTILFVSTILFIFVIAIAYLVKVKEVTSIFVVIAGFNAQLIVTLPSLILKMTNKSTKVRSLVSIALGTIGVWWLTFSPPSAFLGDGQFGGDFGYNVLLVLPIIGGIFLSFLPVLPYIIKK